MKRIKEVKLILEVLVFITLLAESPLTLSIGFIALGIYFIALRPGNGERGVK